MQKSVLRNCLQSLAIGQEILLNFKASSGRVSDSGFYVVQSRRRGRGKGGSVIVSLDRARRGQDSPEHIEVSTGDSDKVLNVQLNHGAEILGESADRLVLGEAVDRLEPVRYSADRNAQVAAGLKEQFRSLLDTGHHGRFHVINVVASVPELNGEFVVRAAKQYRGRVGQIVLELARQNSDERVMLCSYSHSGVVSAVNLLSNSAS